MTWASPSSLARDLGNAGALLPEACQEGFARVAKLIRARLGRFQLIFLDCRDERLRDRLIADLDDFVAASGGRFARLDLDRGRHRDFADVETALLQLAADHEVIHIRGGPVWFDAARWASFNIRREAVARRAKASLLFWLDEETIAALARVAIDLWAWRAAVVTFASTPGLPSLPKAQFRRVDDRAASERERRIGYLSEAVLAPDLPDELRSTLYFEMGDLLFGLGRPSPALRAYHEALRQTQDERSWAITKGRIADVLQARGELDEVLRIRREEELPVYERLADERLKAVTMGQIADVLEAQGELDEALRIMREEELPVYERLGDLRSRAATMGRIAQVLAVRGDLDEALRIMRQELLPVFERLGDVRSRAVTMGQIADIVEARGELAEALRIRREEELPVYERLGDERSRAVTLFRIASSAFGRTYDHQGDGSQTLAAALEAFKIFDRLGMPDGVAHTGLLLARIMRMSDRLAEAASILTAVRAGFAKLNDADGMRQVDDEWRFLKPPS